MAAKSAAAQKVTVVCEAVPGATSARPTADTTCAATVAHVDSIQQAVLRFRVRGIPDSGTRPLVRFSATDGRVAPDTVRLDTSNAVTVTWVRPRGNDEVAVLATVMAEVGTASVVVRLSPRQPTKTAYRVAIASGSPQAGYEKSTLRYPLWVEVLRDHPTDSIITDVSECRRQRIVFRRASTTGSIMPDTSLPFVGEARRLIREAPQGVSRNSRFQVDTTGTREAASKARDGCWATALWTLGEGPGIQHVRAHYVVSDRTKTDTPPAQFSALGRALPRLIAGYASTYQRRYQALRPAATRIETQERPLPEGGTVSYTTTNKVGRDSVVEKGDSGRASALVGMSFAPIPRWRSLTTFVGVGADDPSNDWYVGVSLFRLARKLGGWVPETETLLFDAQLVVNAGRVDVVSDPASCLATPMAVQACDTRKDLRLFRGAGVLVSLDAGSLLGEAFKRLIGS